jgi:hypothetical protein
MPHLESGIDTKGRPWATVCLPKAFGEHMRGMAQGQRLATLRGLIGDLKRVA